VLVSGAHDLMLAERGRLKCALGERRAASAGHAGAACSHSRDGHEEQDVGDDVKRLQRAQGAELGADDLRGGGVGERSSGRRREGGRRGTERRRVISRCRQRRAGAVSSSHPACATRRRAAPPAQGANAGRQPVTAHAIQRAAAPPKCAAAGRPPTTAGRVDVIIDRPPRACGSRRGRVRACGSRLPVPSNIARPGHPRPIARALMFCGFLAAAAATDADASPCLPSFRPSAPVSPKCRALASTPFASPRRSCGCEGTICLRSVQLFPSDARVAAYKSMGRAAARRGKEAGSGPNPLRGHHAVASRQQPAAAAREDAAGAGQAQYMMP